MKHETEELDAKAAAEGFWDDMESAQKILQRSSALKAKLADYEALVAEYQDAVTMVELANEEGRRIPAARLYRRRQPGAGTYGIPAARHPPLR